MPVKKTINLDVSFNMSTQSCILKYISMATALSYALPLQLSFDRGSYCSREAATMRESSSERTTSEVSPVDLYTLSA